MSPGKCDCAPVSEERRSFFFLLNNFFINLLYRTMCRITKPEVKYNDDNINVTYKTQKTVKKNNPLQAVPHASEF